MRPNQRLRLNQLRNIVELKAALAKSAASELVAEKERLQAMTREILGRTKMVRAQSDSPELAVAASRFLIFCNAELREINSELARVQVELDKRLHAARNEEGRRQVVVKLGKR